MTTSPLQLRKAIDSQINKYINTGLIGLDVA